MSGHTGAVVQLKFSPDGDTIYTASTDKTVSINGLEILISC